MISRSTLLGLSALGLCMATASAQTPPPGPLSAQAEQALSLTRKIMGAMEEMITAIEKTTDEATAKEAAATILNSSETITKLAQSGRELQAKLTEVDKKQLAGMEKQFMDTKFQERFASSFMALVEKPELMKILQPAMQSFSQAAMSMAPESMKHPAAPSTRTPEAPLRLRDKGGLQVPPQEPKALAE